MNNKSFGIVEISPLAVDIKTLKWEPITIRLSAKCSPSDFKEVDRLIVKGYSDYKDAEIVVNKGINVNGSTIMIQNVSYCSIL